MEGLVGKEAVESVFARLCEIGHSFPFERLQLLDLVRGKKVQWRWDEWVRLDEFLGIVAPPRIWSVAEITKAFEDWFKNPPDHPMFRSHYERGMK